MIKIILAVLFVILAATFSTLNREENLPALFFGWATGPFPLFFLVLACLVIGMALGFSVDWAESWKLKSKARGLRKQVKNLRKEIENPDCREDPSRTYFKPSEIPKTTPG